MARQALGRGLNALIPAHLRDLDADPKAGAAQDLPIAEIRPNPYQPRTTFKPEVLRTLADSIREQGVLQPILVVRSKAGGYELVSGERRLRAVQLLGWARVPAVIKASATKQEMAEWAIIENVQRDDLNPMEQARAYRRLLDEFKLTQDEVAKKVGLDRATVANMLRLLRLPKEIQSLLEKGELQMGHARALLSIESADAQKALGLKAVREGWSVRAVEKAGQERAAPGKRGSKAAKRGGGAELAAVEERLRRKLGTKVKLIPGPAKGGRIEIYYYGAEELERLIDALT